MIYRTFYPIIVIVILLFSSCQHNAVDYLNEPEEEKVKRMEWWEDARFGMFIHWGLYSIPAGEWNGETNHAEWIRTTAQIPRVQYREFAAQFNPVNYDPKEWVRIAKDAGMKYIIITSKHHDGFCLFESRYTRFDVKATPYEDDLLEPLAEACAEEGIKLGFYYSIMDWYHSDYFPRRSWEVNRPDYGANFDRYNRYIKNQMRELLNGYGDIAVLWFDGEWEETWTTERGKDLYNYVRNLQPGIIINNRVDIGRSGMAGLTRSGEYAGDFGTPEQQIPQTGLPGVYWETCMTMNDHWGYNKTDDNWKSSKELIRKLADIASKGGNFLLNVGPRADGTFPQESIQRLNDIGKWTDVNGESIYETQASPFASLDFGKCTFKPDSINGRLFFHVFEWPEDNILKIPGIYNEPANAFILSDLTRKRLLVNREEDALLISLPDNPPDTINTVVVLDIKGKIDVNNPPEIITDNGIFVDLISVNIACDRENVDIFYTLDGSMPDTSSTKVEGTIILRNTATIAARCFRDGKPVSDSVRLLIRKVEPLPDVDVKNIVPGLFCKYYEGIWDSLPNFNSITPLKQIPIAGFTLNKRERNDHYGFTFEGYIQINEEGVYDFFTESDDGSELFINEILVVDNDGLHGMEEVSGEVPLKKGLYSIHVRYFEKDGGDRLKISYDGPGFDKMPIPKNVLFRKK